MAARTSAVMNSRNRWYSKPVGPSCSPLTTPATPSMSAEMTTLSGRCWAGRGRPGQQHEHSGETGGTAGCWHTGSLEGEGTKVARADGHGDRSRIRFQRGATPENSAAISAAAWTPPGSTGWECNRSSRCSTGSRLPRRQPTSSVNGPLSNLPEFAAAFGCQPGDAMVRPEELRASIWQGERPMPAPEPAASLPTPP